MPTLNWYTANARNLNYEAEKGTTSLCQGFQPSRQYLADLRIDLLEEKKHLTQPTLFISAAKDYIALPAMQLSAMEPWISKLTVEDLDTAHWAQLEAADRVNELLQRFFGGS
jgi:pimeloyl-ACP methyl ester carboxylesterase